MISATDDIVNGRLRNAAAGAELIDGDIAVFPAQFQNPQPDSFMKRNWTHLLSEKVNLSVGESIKKV